MPASPLTIQAWFQAPAQYSSSPQRAQGGEGGGSWEYKEQDLGWRGQRMCGEGLVCVCVCVVCLLYEVLERDTVAPCGKGRCHLLASVNPAALQSEGLTGRRVFFKHKTNQIP